MSEPGFLPPLHAGVYRHYKGPLYQVLGYAHDANADTLWVQGGQPGVRPLRERFVVVYIGLETKEAHTGPRLAVRDVEDFFFAHIHPIGDSEGSECTPDCATGREHVARFTYLGPGL